MFIRPILVDLARQDIGEWTHQIQPMKFDYSGVDEMTTDLYFLVSIELLTRVVSRYY